MLGDELGHGADDTHRQRLRAADLVAAPGARMFGADSKDFVGVLVDDLPRFGKNELPADMIEQRLANTEVGVNGNPEFRIR